MLKFWKRGEPAPTPDAAPVVPIAPSEPVAVEPPPSALPETPPAPRRSWLDRLKAGLAKTGTGLTTLFVGA